MINIKDARPYILLRHYSSVAIRAWLKAMMCLIVAISAEAADLPEITGFQPTIQEVIDSSGFIHPGVGLTKSVLENTRAQIIARQEPWYSYYKDMVQSAAAGRDVISSNASASDPTTPLSTAFNSQGFNSRFIADGLKVYTQTLMYYFTGDEIYRANAMNILRVWQKMDPAQYTYFTDAVIHTGVPMNRMMAAADILRHTDSPNSALAWTEADTINLTNNLITPAIETFMYSNGAFMNQHTYALQGAMAGYIFTGNLERYHEAVEWMTVNKTAPNQGFNGAIKRLFRLVEKNAQTGEVLETPVVQHVEMGRDQAHGGGDLNNATIIAHMFYAQDTKVDPVSGEISEASNAVGMYEFLDDRVLQAADYFWRFMAGYDTDWVPTEYSIFPDGRVGGTYNSIARHYRGRMLTTNFWDLYYYYTYKKGVDLSVVAPYFYQGFKKRIPTIYYYGRGLGNAWNSVDGGADFWLYIPAEAAQEGAANLPKPQLNASIVEPEERYTAFDNNSQTLQEDDADFIRMVSTPAGTQIVLLNFNYGSRPDVLLYGIRLRTNGVARLILSEGKEATPYLEIEVPNTHNEWRYIVYDVGTDAIPGGFGGNFSLTYLAAKGDGTTVDIDHINVNAGTELSAPSFVDGIADQLIYAYAGAHISTRFTAVDTDTSDTLTYYAEQLPAGATFDMQTGAFDWTLVAAGDYSLQISVSDGTSTIAKRIAIRVAADRESAIARVSQDYHAENLYTTDSLKAYQEAYAAALAAMAGASDDVFRQLLDQLLNAVNQLKLVSPRLADGSLDYANTVATSTFGSGIYALTDGDPDSATGFRRTTDLYHIMDFGIDHKVSATAIGIQARLSFPDRGAGVTAFASNDAHNWVRITPEESSYQVDMSMLPVDPAYQDIKYRYFKIQMIHPQPDSLRDELLNIFELGELRIYGLRYEINNKIEAVSIDPAQAGANGMVYSGGELTFNVTTKEVVQNLNVRVQGVEAQVVSDDGQHWTVKVMLDNDTPPGILSYYLQYTIPATGEVNDAFIQSTLYLTNGTNLINNIPSFANLIDPSTSYGRPSASVTAQQVNALFDNDTGTVSDFRLGGNGSGGYITFDFNPGGSVSLAGVDILARQDGYYARISGTVIQASNDNQQWTTISSAARATTDWQPLTINDQQRYRYIRIYNGGNWFGNMAEVRFHGEYQGPVDLINTISLVSAVADGSGLVHMGDQVSLNIGTTAAIENMQVTIQGVAATVEKINDSVWLATATMAGNINQGYIQFAINYTSASGATGAPENQSTDDSALYLIHRDDLLNNLTEKTNLIDPSTSYGRPNESVTLANVNALFDGNPDSVSDFRMGASGNGGYITFDFKEGNSIWFSGLDVLARQDQYYTRINGAVVQGSVDNVTWTTISSGAVATKDWQTLASSAQQTYRYIRIYNQGNWFGNMAEVRFHADVVAPVTLSDAPQGWMTGDVVVTLSATDNNSGVADTFYTMGSTAVQSGTRVSIITEGANDLIFWSEDKAGNIESINHRVINIDKTAPVVQLSALDVPVTNGGTIEDYQTLDIQWVDAVSGVGFVEVRLDGMLITNDPAQNTTSVAVAGKLGSHQIVVVAEDKAGNRQEQTFAINVVTSITSLQHLFAAYLTELENNSPFIRKLEGIMDDIQQANKCELDGTLYRGKQDARHDCHRKKRILYERLRQFKRELTKNKAVAQLGNEAIVVLKKDTQALIEHYRRELTTGGYSHSSSPKKNG